MSRVYINQSYLRVELTAGVDVTDALSTEIVAKKPISGDLDYLPASILSPTTGVLYYDYTDDSSENAFVIDEVGTWRFWTLVTFADGRTASRETLTYEVYNDEDEC